jgi:hypothetical protein
MKYSKLNLIVLVTLLASLMFTGILEFSINGKFANHLNADMTYVNDSEMYRFKILISILIIIISINLLNIKFFTKIINQKNTEDHIYKICYLLVSFVFILIVYINWHFETDDKWVYFRTSLNVLRYGLPYWNPEDRVNIQASTFWPYFSSIGHVLGSWELFTKIWSLFCIPLLAYLFVNSFNDKFLRLVGFTFVMTFFPLILWSMGGQETATAVLYLVLITFAFLKAHNNNQFYLLFLCYGTMMWVRPDTLLIGAVILTFNVLMVKASLKQRFLKIVFFSFPIILFFIFNIYFFDKPFPSPYYVKGLNKAFSGHYPLYYDFYIGLTHFFSAVFLSLPLIFVFVYLAKKLSFNIKYLHSPISWVICGCLLHSIYIISMGYQHMNFTFRYQTPSIILLGFSLLIILDKYINTSEFFDYSFISLSLKIQIPFSILIATHAAIYDISLTRAPLRDLFSTTSYASYINSWLKAGEYMKANFKPEDKIFIFQNLAGASIIDSYALDQFYFGFSTSGFGYLKEDWNKYGNSYLYEGFNYILSFPDEKFHSNFPLHYKLIDFSLIDNPEVKTLTILKRKDDWKQNINKFYIERGLIYKENKLETNNE